MHKSATFDEVFSNFLNVIHYSFIVCIPRRTVTVHSMDPAFVTPYIKLLLRKRNRLFRMGHFERAKAISDKIQASIARVHSNILTRASDCDTTELWNLLKKDK
jgi:hypothetical protein